MASSSVAFNGGSSLTRGTALPSGTTFTWCGWVYLVSDNGTGENYVWSCLTGTYQRVYISLRTPGTTVQVSGDNVSVEPLGWTVATGEWRWVALTINGTGASSITLHWSAANDTAGALSSASGTITANSTPWTEYNIGNNRGDIYGQWPFIRMRHARLWSAVLSGAELLAERASLTAVRTSGLYNVTELATAATAVADASGNARPMDINNDGGAAFSDVALGPIDSGGGAASGPPFAAQRLLLRHPHLSM